MLLLEGEREPVDDGAEDLQQLGHAVVSLRFVDKVVKDVVNLFPIIQGEKISLNKSNLPET